MYNGSSWTTNDALIAIVHYFTDCDKVALVNMTNKELIETLFSYDYINGGWKTK